MKSIFFSFFCSLLIIPIFGQKISGLVVDDKDLPIQFVNILNKTTGQHTHSDVNGNYYFDKASLGDTLEFYYISFERRQVIIDNVSEPLYVRLTTSSIKLDEVVISPKVNALNIISDIDIQANPVASSQDILRKVPGLFIGQHAGGGKAEQIFLRGFDIDHGTDIDLSVDGLPVNMVSHAHGQGYADLHFVIPETIDKIDFGKGPYFESKGNFNTAGYVNFVTKSKLDDSSIKLESGRFGSHRILGMFNMIDSYKHNAYLSTEYLATDGPFESSQHFQRKNIFGKYSGIVSETDRISMSASFFDSRWDASGQIPQRAVDNGLISRFGAIDDTEGGSTSRSNLLVCHEKFIDENIAIKNTAFLSQYDFELFSNFTFFLDDTINGDQIKQRENRYIYGVKSDFSHSFTTNKFDGLIQAGVSLRSDQSNNNELSHTVNRIETVNIMQLGDINETNIGAYIGSTLNVGRWTVNPSLRLDHFDFLYYDRLAPTYITQSTKKSIISPKLNIIYNPSQNLQLYIKAGKGFHSNDTRVVTFEKDKKTIPSAYGSDLGFIWKPSPKILVNVAYWHLFLEQEFVYVGDAGIVEPSGQTRRQGLDLSCRYQPFQWLIWNLDGNYTNARSIDEVEGSNFIPLAPDFSIVSGINITHPSGIYSGINLRHLGHRPANEDNSLVAKGYTITDLSVGYKWRRLNFGIQVQNLFDVAWNETQFATESRLSGENMPIEEIHFTPGTPFFIKSLIEYSF